MSERLAKHIQTDSKAMQRIYESMYPSERITAEAEKLAEKLDKRTKFNHRVLAPATAAVIVGFLTEIALTPHGLSPEQMYLTCMLTPAFLGTLFHNFFSRDVEKDLKSKLNSKISELPAELLKTIIKEKEGEETNKEKEKVKNRLMLGDDGELIEREESSLHLNNHRD